MLGSAQDERGDPLELVDVALPIVMIAPGIAATLALTTPREVPLPIVIGSVIGLGYSMNVLWATLLVLLHVFIPVTFFAGLALITIVLGVVAWGRCPPTRSFALWNDEFRAERWPLVIGGAAVLVFAVASIRGLSPALNFGVVNPFRYWADGVEVAAAGSVPEATLQWGSLHDPAVSKLGFSSFAGAIDFLTNDPIAGMSIAVIVGVVGIVLAAWGLGRAVGFRYSAPLIAILSGSTIFFLKKSLIIRMNSFSADGFAALAATTGAAFGIHAIRTRSRATVVPAALAFAAGALTHLVPTLIALALVACYGLVDLAIHRKPKDVVIAAGACVAAVLLSFLIVALGSGGAVGFDAVESREAIDTEGGTFDPTYYLISGDPGPTPDRAPEERLEKNDGWYTPPDGVLRAFLGDPGTGTIGSILLVVGVGAIAVALTSVAPSALKPLPVAAYLVWIAILLAGFGFNRLYETYVPAVFPQRRLFSFVAFPLILIGLAAVELTLTRLERKSRRNVLLATAGVTVIALIVTFPRPVFKPKVKNARHALAMINWVNENIPCDARIFASQRTAGIFQALTGRPAVSEGMAPYLRPPMLNEVVDLLLDGRDFLQDPDSYATFLSSYDIDYLVISKDAGLLDRTPPLLGLADEGALQVSQDLELLRDEPRYAIYEVTQADDDRAAPDASSVNGYKCRTDELTL